MAKNIDETTEEVEQDTLPDSGEQVDESSRISNATSDEGDVSDATLDDSETEETPGNDSAETEGNTEDEQDSFSREYVQKLRDENARYRQRAGRADELAHSLHRVLVEQTGRLADPSDLEFNEDHLDDPEALTAAIDELLSNKPHLATRIARGDIDQGATPSDPEFSLTGIMRNHA